MTRSLGLVRSSPSGLVEDNDQECHDSRGAGQDPPVENSEQRHQRLEVFLASMRPPDLWVVDNPIARDFFDRSHTPVLGAY